MSKAIKVHMREPEFGSIEQPFEGDAFDRKKLAEKLTSLMARAAEGMVIAVDAPWGEGKTWFGRHWHAMLAAEGYRTAYIDCFRHDYVDDPFLMVAGEVLTLTTSGEDGSRRKLLAAGKKLGASLIPSAAKLVANAVGHWAIGNAGLGNDMAKALAAAEEGGAAALEKLMAKRLEDYEADKKSVDGFRSALADFASEEDKPVVVFLDELDRCRPDFAVRTLERVKHFFDVPKVFFVLLMNRKQLSAAIEGVYGPKVAADAYLGKFVHMTLSLPKRRSIQMRSNDDNARHCASTMVRYGFQPGHEAEQFAMCMGVLATLMNLSLRDMERAVTLYSYAQPTGDSPEVAWSIALKVSVPTLFGRLRDDDRKAHEEAASMAGVFADLAPDLLSLLGPIIQIHRWGANGWKPGADSRADDPEQIQLARRGGAERLFRWAFEKVDLSVTI